MQFLFREASVRAIESVQEASLKALAKQNVQRGLRSVRRKHWFEKFNWFISSEGYLILSGSDAQQNVILSYCVLILLRYFNFFSIFRSFLLRDTCDLVTFMFMQTYTELLLA